MSGTNGIPFLDLVTPHKELKEELCQVFATALDTAGFIGGPMVQGFEEDFAQYCDAAHCIGVNSGTDALRFAFIAAGIGSGDIMVTVSNTFIATTEAISQAGARPAFVDIDEATYNMDPAKLREYLEVKCTFDAETRTLTDRKSGGRVAAIVPVHLYGQMVDMDAILELADKYGLMVFEDACQAHGAEYFSKKENRWRKAGSMGKAAAFSFYPGKNLGACGEGGAVTTNDADLAKKVRMLRDHGQNQKYYHEVEGYNGRLDSIQAGILRVKLKHLPEWTQKRQAAASRYRELFAGKDAKVVLPFEPSWSKAVYHLFVVRTQDRDELMKQLGAAGIGTGIHYPIPLHLQNAYKDMGYKKGDLPITEKVAVEIVSLPMFPGLDREQQARVVAQVSAFAPASKYKPIGPLPFSMLSPESDSAAKLGARLVTATFGRREPRQDPAWEQEFAASLRSSQSKEELLGLFAQFRGGDTPFEALMRRVLMRAICKRVGNDLQVAPNVVLKHPETMEFGDSVFIGAQVMIQGRFDGTCRIGNHVWIGPQAYFDARDLVSEDYVGLGPGAKVLGSTHTGIPVDEPTITTGLVIKPVRVGFGADVGMNASVLPGMQIGKQAIVGAGAVVTHDVPEYAIVAGVPARFLRDRRKS